MKVVNENPPVITQPYRLFTSYSTVAQFKKLDFIVENIENRYRNCRSETKILELGCGEANSLLPLASLGYITRGVDINTKSIDICIKKNIFENCSFEIKDITNRDIYANEGNKYDVVILTEVLEHLKRPSLVVGNIHKILKKDGIIIITIPNGFGPWELFFNIPISFLIRNYKIKKHSMHFQHFTINSFKKLLSEYNIYITKINHSKVFSSFPIISKISSIAYYDCVLADKLPHFLVSGWYFICKIINDEGEYK